MRRSRRRRQREEIPSSQVAVSVINDVCFHQRGTKKTFSFSFFVFNFLFFVSHAQMTNAERFTLRRPLDRFLLIQRETHTQIICIHADVL